jgi:hypothetical protein
MQAVSLSFAIIYSHLLSLIFATETGRGLAPIGQLVTLEGQEVRMCRNIRPLFNFEPPATDEEIRASALQFVRKVSGFTKPSQANAEAFESAVDEVTEAARKLIFSLHSAAPPRDRETEARKAQERSRLRYG